MARLVLTSRLAASPQEAFELLAKPRNLPLLLPRELRARLLDAPPRLEEGAELGLRLRLLGQDFLWRLRVIALRPPEEMVLEAIEAPFVRWRHSIQLQPSHQGLVLRDVVEFSSILGPLADGAARRAIGALLRFRNEQLASLALTGRPRAGLEYRDPLRLSLAEGLGLCLGAGAGALLLLWPAPGLSLLPQLLAGLFAWALLWFFTHDLAHVLAGWAVGVRFSYFYLGLSNLVRALRLRPAYRLLFPALGVKVDKSRSRASGRGLFAMYLAGPLATIALPFLAPARLLAAQPSSLPGQLLLMLSLANVAQELLLSPKHGCIAKALRALRA